MVEGGGGCSGFIISVDKVCVDWIFVDPGGAPGCL